MEVLPPQATRGKQKRRSWKLPGASEQYHLGRYHKSETRNPKSETSSNTQWFNDRNFTGQSSFGHFWFTTLDLFRVSDFGFVTA